MQRSAHSQYGTYKLHSQVKLDRYLLTNEFK